MAQKYRLIERRNLGKDQAANPKKFYAQAVNSGYVTFDELCEEIAEQCTLTSADIKAVADRMNHTLDRHLKKGRIVQFGEIGNFRLGVGSSGAVDAKSFSADQIRKPKIIFTPGKFLQMTRINTEFSKETEEATPATPTPDGPKEDGGGNL